ncbi:MAG: phosphoribosylformylglycinamidine cyclo-ligase [Candidatus Pelagibacter sp. TMED197]|nr:phosphoribosylformylglycinamidine cyclo-ligase [Candidatus Pelagibacter sp.]OUW57973.1 MAG: phosphoribosylformylglycinamidine cyclo-ligase [Candidatus Pelagibacter sp. TMED197]|tara:strand:- start:269 stop:1297 length:1029 start_codon:yes stop_codon:yes gene_type:complete
MKKIQNSYKKSGVNISVANKFVKHIAKISKKNVKKTNKAFNSNNIGAFGSTFDISNIKIKDPVIVSCTDGVGTKLDLANKFKKFDSIGIDLVAMCVNDLVVQGAKPLFFLDYIAVGKLNLKKIKSILKGILKGCKISQCELIGGETAEMPGIYSKDKFDLAGFSVGIVSKKKILNKNKVKKDNLILAIPSSGVHSNGYSLIRAILNKNKISRKLKKELLSPTKIYTREILKLTNKNLINAAAHITGGGLIENITRSIPDNLSVDIDLSKIRTRKIFSWLKSKNLTDLEMLRTFNCGVGFCIIIKKKNLKKIKKYFTKDYMPYEIGYVTKKNKKLNLFNNIKW